jgi:hypothetical protein
VPFLNSELRNILERAVIEARDVAEAAARTVLTVLAVDQKEAPEAMSPEQRRLRVNLRAKARQLGSGLMTDGFKMLLEEIAYQQWHRMLFARFLAENNLLVHPTEGVSVSLQDCAELATEEGEPDLWGVAAKYASMMLPGIFQSDDATVQVRLAPESRLKLEGILNDLPVSVFTADDSLGWIYQFWQSKRKDEVNRSGKKIGGADLAPVTQLFTENYMVRLLLDNSLGAWWAARHPNSPLLKTFKYLRFCEDGTPAAGVFSGWPSRVAEITIIDPCCGSGHFLVVAFDMFRRMRMEEEGIRETEAADAVIRDNLFGLEIDERCVQIATFALALATWKVGGYRPIPLPNVACSGIAVQGQMDTWTRLANNDENLKHDLQRLYSLFSKAPDLGSLINPAHVPVADRMFTPDYEQVAPVLEKALAKERNQDDPVAAVFGLTAQGAARAARFLAMQYTLVATNVPYLARGKQGESLKAYLEAAHPLGKGDLATAFLERCLAFTSQDGAIAIVTPQNWFFLVSYRELRKHLLSTRIFNLVARLGPGAFETISGHVVNVSLNILTAAFPNAKQGLVSLDVINLATPNEKEEGLRKSRMSVTLQDSHLRNPDCRIIFGQVGIGRPLKDFAIAYEGLHSGDYTRFGRKFWELDEVTDGWVLQQGGPDRTMEYRGREHILFWEDGAGTLIRHVQQRLNSETVSMWIKGKNCWGKAGVAVSVMSDLKATLYTGEVFTHGVVVIVPNNPDHIGALWAFCKSSEFRESARKLDQKVSIARAVFDHLPFDLPRWKKIADEAGTLLEPSSNDPTQWVFDGDPANSTEPLQVAVARLLGYRWPQQTPDHLDDYADRDGIVCLMPIAGELPAAERLRTLLNVAHGDEWSLKKQDELLAAVGFGGKNLYEWLRDGFFPQHCRIFHNRPFIWHIWDGRKDGFSALVNYHRFDTAKLDKLIYTYLGAWIKQQREKSEAKEAGADGRLVSALELQKQLEKIREGESPFDIYIRWKSIDKQPIGWNPDLNDGIRLNIRPFFKTGVLRSRFVINWNKDRGNNLDGSERRNDCHLTIVEKLSLLREVMQEQR